MDIPFDETFALATDRAGALQQLVPGTEDYYFYHCLHNEHLGRRDEIAKLIETWIERHGRTARVEEVLNRQALLFLGKDPKKSWERLRDQINPSFHHQADVEGRVTRHPHALDPKSISRAELKKRAFSTGSRSDLSGFSDAALEWLGAESLEPDRRRAFLGRLRRPDVPGLVDLVLADLKHKNSSGFGSLAIHRALLQDQLAEMARREPALLKQENFVHACISRLHPGPESDWQNDPAEKQAYLERLWDFVGRLAPAFNHLKTHVLHHRLDFDRSQGVFDRARFQAYLEIPRSVSYAEPKFLERCRKDALLRDAIFDLGHDFSGVTLLPVVSEDESLVADLFSRIFADAKDVKPWDSWVRDSSLKVWLAETKILGGAGDPEKWASLLNDPAHYQALKDRVELSFPRHNRATFAATEPVKIDVDVKHVETLTVKVFELNTLNYYSSAGQEVDASIDLDGLVAAEEKTHTYKETPFRRVRRTFEFPTLSRAGIFVVEFIGGGISSRALVRKGRLRFLERVGSAGHVFTVLDEDARPVRNASIWLGGREFAAEADGTITIPFSERPGPQQILIRSGSLTTLEAFEHRAESYSFTAGIYVDREALLRRTEAQVLIRPTLSVHGAPVSLKLLEQPVLTVRSTDRHGVESSMEIRDLELRDDQETLVPFQVPEDLVRIAFAVRGRVESLSSGKKVDVADERSFTVNGIEATEKTQDLHLARTEDGWLLHVLGKTGEARPETPVSLTLRYRCFSFATTHTLQTDGRGRVELGALDEVEHVEATIPSGVGHSWGLRGEAVQRPSTIHARSGETVRVPFLGERLGRESVALLEQVGGVYREDHFGKLDLKDGYLTIGKLGPGDYELRLKEEGVSIALRISGGEVADGWTVARTRMLQSSPSNPVHLSEIKAGKEDLRVRVGNATPRTRVHVFATRFVPEHSAFHELGRTRPPAPWARALATLRSAFVSGRDLGDEYRYILERKASTPRPGNMLTRPGLLLNPWALRSTQTSVADARGGGGYAAESMAAPCAAAPPECAPGAEAPEAGAFACLDFLANPAAVLANLRPGKDGTVTVPRKALAHANQVTIVAVDESGVVSRSAFLPETRTAPRDLRLRLGLDPARHFTEKKDVAILDGGAPLVIADLTTSKIESYDTLTRIFSLYRTLSGNAALDAFEFVTRWPRLGEDERRAKISEFACHELHLFLSRKDPDFFRKVIQPYLKNKKDKTFLDLYLIGEDLTDFVRPWEFGRLNIVERILLGRRIAAERGPVSRHASDLCEMLVRDLVEENRLFDTALKGKALEAGDALGIAAAVGRAEEEREATRAASGMGLAKMSVAMADMADLDEASMEKAKDEAPRPASKKARSMRGPADADLRRRGKAKPLYRTLDQTQEWAENNYYRLPIEQQGPDLVTLNRFWRDFARQDERAPFVSPHLAEAHRNLTEMLCALAVLDLPFEASKPGVTFDGARMDFKPKDRTAVFHRQIKPAEPAPERVPILVSQNFLRDDDRVRYEGEEQFDKYVTDEFLVHTVYACQVVLTNPTSSTHKLDLLLQIPMGAIPVKNGFQTRGMHVELGSYAAQSIEYAFYFPAAGTYEHYPVHVSKNESMIAAAPPAALEVVERLSRVDKESWAWLSQNADGAAVLKHLETHNVDRLDLELIAWRMQDRKFYDAALDLLAKRHVYQDTLWSYALHHQDAERAREFLMHQEDWLRGCGKRLDGGAAPIDPVALRWHQHLEYLPLVNARAQRLGASRRILNDRFSAQYASLMEVLRYRAKPDDDDLLAAAYYLFLQDRVEEALAALDRVRRERVDAKLQYDYLGVYAEFYRENPKAARAVAEKHRDHPVDRWRKLFRSALAQLDEIEGAAAAVADAEDRDQRQGALAAEAPAFEFAVEDRTVAVQFRNLERLRVNYYRMDLELLFSRQPFVQEQSERFGFIMPNRSDEVALPKKGGTHSFPLPAEFNGANVVVELVAAGRRVSKPCFAHELSVQVSEPYGQLQVVRRGTRKPLPKAYVKAYARQQDGTVRFYKDGYTDLRGRFDYSSLSTDDLDRVDRFALLVSSDGHGAVVQEAAPPKR